MSPTLAPRRVRGKRGRGASGKTIVFGLLKRQGKVYTEIVPNVSRKRLQAVIRGKVGLDGVIHSDGWRGYKADWSMSVMRNTFVYIMVRINLPGAIVISMALNPSGHLQKEG